MYAPFLSGLGLCSKGLAGILVAGGLSQLSSAGGLNSAACTLMRFELSKTLLRIHMQPWEAYLHCKKRRAMSTGKTVVIKPNVSLSNVIWLMPINLFTSNDNFSFASGNVAARKNLPVE